MTITICGSIAFIKEMYELKAKLESLGHAVLLPPDKVPGEDGTLIDASDYYAFKKSAPANDSWIWQHHSDRISAHFEKVAQGDVVLITNYEKNNVPHYIGSNTLMEMGLAFYLHKPIFLLNPVPEGSNREEVLGMKPIIINGDLTKIV